jgi:predicted nucleic acid-binding protein
MPVVDASIVVDWVAPGSDPQGDAGRLLSRLAREAAPILAPRLLLEECANALVTGIRRRRWSGAQADAAYVLLQQLPVDLVDQPSDLDRAFELSRRYDEHPVHDMVYVAVAERLGEQLVTADDALRSRLGTLPFVVGPD